MDECARSVGTEDWLRLTEAIRADDPEATELLYNQLAGYRLFFGRKIGPEEAEDHFHDLVVAVIAGIKGGALREPTRIAGYARGIAGNMVAEEFRARSRTGQLHLDDSWHAIRDHRPNAEMTTIRREAKDIAARVLRAMPLRDRAVLARFYVDEQCPEQICTEMGLSATQFRLIKSRAKARLALLVQRRIGPGPAPNVRSNRRTA